MEADKNGVTAKNTYGGPLLLRTEINGDKETTYEYLYNAHGDVVTLISDSDVVATYYYDSFGNILDQTGEVDNSILYAGYQYDEETGLYYINARMYDPVTARFLQEDTYLGNINDPLSLNLYTYCLNNPHKYVDPSGHFAITLAVVIGAVIWGLVGAAIEYKLQKDAGGMIDYNQVLFQGVLNAGIALISGGLANGAMATAQGTRMTVGTFGKMMLAEAGLGIAEGVIGETGYQLINGTKVSDLDVGRIAFSGVQGGISGVGGALVGEGIGAGMKALKNSRMVSKAMNKAHALANRGMDAISGGFRTVAADNRGVLDFDAKVGLGEVVESGSNSSKYQNASLWERLTTRKANVNDLYANPLDEFSNPKIGPSDSAVAKYVREINTTGGLSTPIEVQKLSTGGYEIVNGHHRWLAAQKVGLERVPIQIKNYNN